MWTTQVLHDDDSKAWEVIAKVINEDVGKRPELYIDRKPWTAAKAKEVYDKWDKSAIDIGKVVDVMSGLKCQWEKYL